jgi:hypothetical protein
MFTSGPVAPRLSDINRVLEQFRDEGISGARRLEEEIISRKAPFAPLHHVHAGCKTRSYQTKNRDTWSEPDPPRPNGQLAALISNANSSTGPRLRPHPRRLSALSVLRSKSG